MGPGGPPIAHKRKPVLYRRLLTQKSSRFFVSYFQISAYFLTRQLEFLIYNKSLLTFCSLLVLAI